MTWPSGSRSGQASASYRDARPPWGDDVTSDITDLGNYFVTLDGDDMLEVIDAALDYAERSGQGATLKSVGPVGPGPT